MKRDTQGHAWGKSPPSDEARRPNCLRLARSEVPFPLILTTCLLPLARPVVSTRRAARQLSNPLGVLS